MTPQALARFLEQVIESQRSACAQFSWLARIGALVAVVTLIIAVLKGVLDPSATSGTGLAGFFARGEAVIGALSVFFAGVASWPYWQLPEKREKLSALQMLQSELERSDPAPERLQELHARATKLFDKALGV